MNNKVQGKQQKLIKLQAKYTAELPGKFALINNSWATISQNNGDGTQLRNFYRLVHNLAGSAGTFGYRSLSEKSRVLEQKVKQISNSMYLSVECKNFITQTLDDIKLLVNQGPEEIQKSESEVVSESECSTASTGFKLVYIVEDDVLVTQALKSQLQQSKYEVCIYTSVTDAMAGVRKRTPAVMIIDVDLPEEPLAGIDFATTLNEHLNLHVPLIFVSDHDEWNVRLAAVRAGGVAYLTKPLDSIDLLDRLEFLSRGKILDPFRVLIVEDMRVLAEHYALVLRNAGMQVEVVSDPVVLLETLSDFNPELILMDIYMPHCTGLEAAKVIRQRQDMLSVPIVFLSTEADPEQQLSAMQLGGDEFLQKPVSDSRLISTVSFRAERFRELRTFMHYDCMTGLLNHASIKLRLKTAIARTLRLQSTLVFAMLNIDHFKSISQCHGFSMANRMVKKLAYLLEQGLRKSDIIGRYSGREFAVILPDITLPETQVIINEVREKFYHSTGAEEDAGITCSFSAGLASVPPFSDSNSLINAADEALREAKSKGRNRVVSF